MCMRFGEGMWKIGGGSCRKHLCRPKSPVFFFFFLIKYSHMLYCTILLTARKKRGLAWQKWRAHEKGENAGRWPSMIRLGAGHPSSKYLQSTDWNDKSWIIVPLVKLPFYNLTCILNLIKTQCAATVWLCIRDFIAIIFGETNPISLTTECIERKQ